MMNRRYLPYTFNWRPVFILVSVALSLVLIYHQNLKSRPLPPKEEVIEIVYLLGGNTYSRHLFYTHLKSLLSFSNSTFNFHIIADTDNIEDVGVLLKTWNLPKCNYTFYNEQDYTESISWVHPLHYSKQFGYLKLVIPYILPHIDKVLVMDVDLVFQVNVKELWDMFAGFNSTNFLALVPTTSPWYTLDRPGVWPALDGGYNSGLELLDLQKMRAMGWAQKWRNLTERHYARIKANPIADQDIINTWIFENPTTFKRIDCFYNFEVGGGSRQKLCPFPPRLVHYNTPNKEPRADLEKYAAVRKVFLGVDGDVLKRQRETEPSKEYSSYRIIPNAYGRRNRTELCWATDLGVSQVEVFVRNAEFWALPITVVIYGNDSEVNTITERVNSLQRDDVTIHSVYGRDEASMATRKNYFRNYLLEHSNCDQLLISDSHFNVFFSKFGKPPGYGGGGGNERR